MVSPKQMHRIATNPNANLKFRLTGRPPPTFRPHSPLIDLLDALGPRERMAIHGLSVGPELGYGSRRTFQTAEQALRWVRPQDEMFESESFPAESSRLNAFRGPIFLETLLQHASSFPPNIIQRNPRLCNPALRRQVEQETSQDSSDAPAAPAAPAAVDRPRG